MASSDGTDDEHELPRNGDADVEQGSRTPREGSPRAAGPARATQAGGLPVLVVGRPELASQTSTARAMVAGAPAISSDGRFVAFVSASGDLVPGDANDAADVFVRDTMLNRTVLVSRSIHGGTAAGHSLQPSISADGRFVAFTSSAPDLVPGDSNGSLDVFVHDLRSGITTLVSRGVNGELADNDSFSPSLSADGRFVAYSSLATNLDPNDVNTSPDVFLYDRLTGRTSLVSAGSDGVSGDGASGQPSVSGNGRLVAFTSAVNLDSDDQNDHPDVYVHDMVTGENALISRAADGSVANGPSHEPSLSADGDTVAFTSEADNLVDGDTNLASDVFAHRRSAGETRLVSAAADGTPGEGASRSSSVSGDGGRVAFVSSAPDLSPTGSAGEPSDHAYVRDLEGAGTALVSATRDRKPADGETGEVSISSWGRHVAFSDTSTDLAGQIGEGQPHVYVASLRTVRVPAPGQVTGHASDELRGPDEAEDPSDGA